MLLNAYFAYLFHKIYDLDEKEKYDPSGFRDAVISGLERAGNDLDAVNKFLDTAGSKLDYRRYGEALFDILIAGGLLGLFNSIYRKVHKYLYNQKCLQLTFKIVSKYKLSMVFN